MSSSSISNLLRRRAAAERGAERSRRSANGSDERARRRAAVRGGDALAVTEREIAEEIAYSLGKAGRLLEQAIARAQAAFVALSDLDPGDVGYAERREALRSSRAEAERRLRYLRIQREALGLRSHRDLDACYRIP